ncbi:hypothetical protein NL676_034492 [Syzygium grande]|nr:hypothetical protein NL676_034492 [Syzygium grande]
MIESALSRLTLARAELHLPRPPTNAQANVASPPWSKPGGTPPPVSPPAQGPLMQGPTTLLLSRPDQIPATLWLSLLGGFNGNDRIVRLNLATPTPASLWPESDQQRISDQTPHLALPRISSNGWYTHIGREIPAAQGMHPRQQRTQNDRRHATTTKEGSPTFRIECKQTSSSLGPIWLRPRKTGQQGTSRQRLGGEVRWPLVMAQT